jgi:hypothetical protein
VSFDHHAFAGSDAREHFDTAGTATADAHFAPLALPSATTNTILTLGLRRQGFFGNDQRFAFVVGKRYVEEHAGLECAVLVG